MSYRNSKHKSKNILHYLIVYPLSMSFTLQAMDSERILETIALL